MTKPAFILFSAFLIIISAIAVAFPASDIQWLMGTSGDAAVMRLGLAAAFLLLGVFWYYRPLGLRALIGALGICLLGAGIGGLYWSTFLGVMPVQLQPLDFLVAVESGILALLAALEPDLAAIPVRFEAVELEPAKSAPAALTPSPASTPAFDLGALRTQATRLGRRHVLHAFDIFRPARQ